MGESIDRLMKETRFMREKSQDYSLLKRVFGSTQIDALLEQARAMEKGKKRQYTR